MALGRLWVLSSFMIILSLYIGNLLATVDREHLPETNALHKGCHTRSKSCHHNSEIDGLASSLLREDESPSTNAGSTTSISHIIFEPAHINFTNQSIAMPAVIEVKVTNPTKRHTLQLISIIGARPEFHTSFFVNKVLRPGQSTTFSVMFLPKALGYVKDVILIHSSLGIFQFMVQGVGVANPFRLRSLSGARIPVNATYQPTISLYNPFDRPLQILEVYSATDDIQLELTSGVSEGNKTFWEIRPFETKSIARVNFHGRMIDNYTSFIRIVSNHLSQPSIVLPFEVEVCKASGLFISKELLDFGLIRTGGESKLWLYIMNAGPYQIDIRSLTFPDNSPITINFTKTSLKPSLKYVKVALLTYTPTQNESHDQEFGEIKVWGEDHASFYQVVVHFKAHVMKGYLDYDHLQTLFPVTKPPFKPIIRNFTLSNWFQYPLVIYSVTLSSKYIDWFSVLSFQSPYILPPDRQPHSVLLLKFTIQSSDCFFNTTLRLATNMSYFNIPLQCYDGRLHYDFGGQDIDALEFGILTEKDRSSKHFTITNYNPVPVDINRMSTREGSDLPSMKVETIKWPELDLEAKAKRSAMIREGLRTGKHVPPHILEPGQFIELRVNITYPKRTGSFSGEILFHSSNGKITHVPVNYIAVKGGIEVIPTKLNFKTTYPNLPTSIKLKIKNNYTKPLKILSLTLERRHNSLNSSSLPVTLPVQFPVIQPTTTTEVGDIRLDPLSLMKQVTSLDLNKIISINDKEGERKRQLIQKDIFHLQQLWYIWQSLLAHSATLFQFTLKICTDTYNNTVRVNGTGSVVWPSLTGSPHTVTFPLTLYGNYTEVKVTLRNPSSLYSVLLEPLLLSQYIDSAPQLLPLVSEIYDINSTLYNSTNQSFTIISSVLDPMGTKLDPMGTKLDPIGTKPNPIGPTLDPLKGHYMLTLPPKRTATVTIRYTPSHNGTSRTLLILRNNLTVIDYVKLEGTCSLGFITVEGVHPSNGLTNGGGGALQFEFTSSMLEGYMSGMECGLPLNDLSHWKVFHIRNTGPTPFTIKRTSIDSYGCEGRGFKITNCDKPLIVYPNKTRKLEIHCTPDFTLSRITSTLYLHTSSHSKSLQFPLVATLPHHMLATCYSATPPSDMEYIASCVSAPIWSVALLIMVIVTALQVNWHIGRLFRTTPTVAKDVPIQPTGGNTFKLSDLKGKTTPTTTTTTTTTTVGPISSGYTSVSDSTSTGQLINGEREIVPSLSESISIDRRQGVTTKKLSLSSPPSTTPSSQTPPTNTDTTRPSLDISPRQSQAPPTQQIPLKTITTDYHTGIRHEELSNSSVKDMVSDMRPNPPDTPTKKLRNSTPQRKQKQHDKPHPLEERPSEEKIELIRKESDESIPSSESDLGGSGTSSLTGSNDSVSVLSPSGEIEDLTLPATPPCNNKMEVVNDKPHPPPSYATEPLTGQTVVVKEDIGEDLESPSLSSPPPPSLSKTKNRKKQRAQLRREEKLKKKQKEREIEQQQNFVANALKAKKYQGSQESLDKESVASNSTNSTENLEDDPPFVDAPQSPPSLPLSVEKKINTSTNIVINNKKSENKRETKNNEKSNQVISENNKILTNNKNIEKQESFESNLSNREEENIDVNSNNDDSLAPLSPNVSSNTLKNEEEFLSKTPTFNNEMKNSNEKDEEEETFLTPQTPPPNILPAEQKPSKETKKRPQKLHLDDKEKVGGVTTPPETSSSVETDGNNEKRLAPHELAASILTNKAIIVRKNNTNTTSSTSNNKSKNNEKQVNSPPNKKGSSKKSSMSEMDKRNMMGGGASSLSHDAAPFYPGYHPPHPYAPPPHHRRLPLLQPHPPHHLSYEYPPMRYPPEEYMERHYHLQHHRPKRDVQKLINKGYPPHPPVPHPHQYMYPPMETTPPYREHTPPHMCDHNEWASRSSYHDVDYYNSSYRPERSYSGGSGSGHPPPPPPGWRPGTSNKRSSYETSFPSRLPSKHHGLSEEETLWSDPSLSQSESLSRRQFREWQQCVEEMERSDHMGVGGRHLREREYIGIHESPRATSYHDSIDDQIRTNPTRERPPHPPSNSTGLSLLLSQSSSAAGWSSLNRAPGSIPSELSYDRNTGWLLNEDKDLDRLHSTLTDTSPTDISSTCQRLWSMNSPLSNALEEQRLQAATQLSSAPSPPPPRGSLSDQLTSAGGSSNNYELFESSIPNIWSFGSNHSTTASRFPWGGGKTSPENPPN